MLDLEQLIEGAGDATEPPPSPEGGIPKQWLPGFIRWPIRVISLPFVLIDTAMQRVAKIIIRPPFKQVGKCKRRGNCCHYILVREGRGIFKKYVRFFTTQIHGFYLRDKKPHQYEGKSMVVMGCRYLKKDGGCGHYYLRPMMCRKWPVIEHFGYPKMLKGCGFQSDPPHHPDHYEENKLRVLPSQENEKVHHYQHSTKSE